MLINVSVQWGVAVVYPNVSFLRVLAQMDTQVDDFFAKHLYEVLLDLSLT